MRQHLSVGLGIGALLAGCTAQMGAATGHDVGSVEEPVQLDYLSVFAKRPMEAVVGDSVNATASVHVRFVNDDPPTGNGAGSCGATFVSPHYAITAAHCVDRYGSGGPLIAPMEDTIELRQYDTRSLDWFKAIETSVVDGNWPNWSRGTTLTTDDGYFVDYDTNCYVKLRCGAGYQPTANCPAGVTGDIALVYCPDRSASSTWVPVSPTSAAVNDQLEVLWVHELLFLPTGDPGDERFDHYGNIIPDPAAGLNTTENNWHYRTGHQLLPFRSASWQDFTPYKVVGHSGTRTWTDAFGCHGTSGSGVFPVGTTLLLGPVITPGNAFFVDGQNLMCADMDHVSVAPGDQVTAYTNQQQTLLVEGVNIPGEGTVVYDDR